MKPTFLCIPLKSKKKMKSTLLSQDLIVEILLRLPVKSLLRFKCVCKTWLSLISDPQFAKSHFDLAAAPTYRILVQPAYDYFVQSIDTESSLYNDSAVLNLHVPLPSDHYDCKSRILGSCRGFIVYDSNHGNLMLWNPSTNFHIYIPYRRHNSEILHGVGYDASTDDYLIIFVRSEKNYNMVPEYSMQSWVTRLKIFSLKTKSWKTLGDINFPFVKSGGIYRSTGLFLNGALHWLLSCHKTHIDVILVYDLKERRLSEIPGPQYLTMDKWEIHGLGLTILRGCLSICRNLPSYEMVEIWMMKEYRVVSSWTKSIVDLSTIDIRGGYFFPSYFTKGGEIIGSITDEGLAKFNDKGDLLEHQRYHKLIECTVYRESLLLPTTI